MILLSDQRVITYNLLHKALYLESLRSLNNGPESAADQSPCKVFKTIIIQKGTITILLNKRYIEGISFYSFDTTSKTTKIDFMVYTTTSTGQTRVSNKRYSPSSY